MTIEFNTKGYDPFLDFLKAYCIIWVLIGHILPGDYLNYILYPIIGGCQVPLFLIIQSFHAYKKGVKPVIDIKKTLKRIVIPFFVVQTVIIGTILMVNLPTTSNELIINALMGGIGPGSYYFWIYLQFAILLPWFYVILSKLSKCNAFILFFVICVGLDVIFSLLYVPCWLERLLAARYLFLIYLGWIWAKEGVIMNSKNYIFSVMSLLAVGFFMFSRLNLEPLFYNTEFTTHRWVCFFYISSLLILVLRYIYNWCIKYHWLKDILSRIGQSSYEIYLFQMMVFTFFRPNRLFFIDNSYLQFVIWAVMAFILCIIGGMIIHKGLKYYYS